MGGVWIFCGTTQSHACKQTVNGRYMTKCDFISLIASSLQEGQNIPAFLKKNVMWYLNICNVALQCTVFIKVVLLTRTNFNVFL